MKIILLLQLIGDCFAATEKKCLIKPFPVFVDIDRHYMNMVAVDVFMLIDDVWLVAESQFVKVLTGQDFKILIRETVVGMRYRFQTLGEYNAVLSLYNIRCEPTDGKVNGREYHGLVYFAMNDNGDTVSTPFKASRLGKFASRAAVEGHFERSKDSVDVKPTKRMVASVMAQSSDKDDFITRLNAKGIDLVLRYNEEGRIYGATFVDHNTHTVLNGSRLGKEFSANAFERWFNGDGEKPVIMAPVTPDSDTTRTAGDTSTPPQSNPSTGQSHSRTHDYENNYEQPTLPGLDLFQVGPGFNPEEEAFYRAMQRRKKRRRGPQL